LLVGKLLDGIFYSCVSFLTPNQRSESPEDSFLFQLISTICTDVDVWLLCECQKLSVYCVVLLLFRLGGKTESWLRLNYLP